MFFSWWRCSLPEMLQKLCRCFFFLCEGSLCEWVDCLFAFSCEDALLSLYVSVPCVSYMCMYPMRVCTVYKWHSLINGFWKLYDLFLSHVFLAWVFWDSICLCSLNLSTCVCGYCSYWITLFFPWLYSCRVISVLSLALFLSWLYSIFALALFCFWLHSVFGYILSLCICVCSCSWCMCVCVCGGCCWWFCTGSSSCGSIKLFWFGLFWLLLYVCLLPCVILSVLLSYLSFLAYSSFPSCSSFSFFSSVFSGFGFVCRDSFLGSVIYPVLLCCPVLLCPWFVLFVFSPVPVDSLYGTLVCVSGFLLLLSLDDFLLSSVTSSWC